MRGAAELKARDLAMPNLVMRELADRMTEDDLPEDLKEKVEIALTFQLMPYNLYPI